MEVVVCEAQDELREVVNAEKLAAAGRLAAWLAHRVNNPLGAISGNAQLLARRLERDIDDPTVLQAYRRYLDAIQSQVERCAGVTNDLLDFTREPETDVRSVNVTLAVSEAVELAQYDRSPCVISIAPGVNNDLPLIRADKDLLVRVLHEVISNAMIAAGPEGAVTVDAENSQVGTVRILVIDNGSGIPEDVLPRIFEPFFSTRERARGLGLTMSLSIMRRLGGGVEIVRTGPEGTVVAVEATAARSRK